MAEAENPSQEAAPQGDATPAAAPKKKFQPVMILLILQMLVIGASTFLIVKGTLLAKRPVIKRQDLEERAIASVVDSESRVVSFDLDQFTVNLPQKHILKTQLKIEVSNEATAEVLTKRKPALQARVLSLLSQQNADRIDKLQGKLLLKDNLKDVLNEELAASGEHVKGAVRDVYFIDFMLN